ncbi:unnamed protein product, partial [Ilex paraguariensis]
VVLLLRAVSVSCSTEGRHASMDMVGTMESVGRSLRGCIFCPDLYVLNLVIVKEGENDLPGLTDTKKRRMRGPKRASKIRKLFNLFKEVQFYLLKCFDTGRSGKF